jgi:hypothetical protein
MKRVATNQVSTMENSNNRFKGSFFPVEMVESRIRVFDSLASDYDAWFEEEGRLIFASLVRLRAV